MQALIAKLLGANPKTSALGLIVAVLGIVHEALKAGETDFLNIAMAVVMGVIGLQASDAKK